MNESGDGLNARVAVGRGRLLVLCIPLVASQCI